MDRWHDVCGGGNDVRNGEIAGLARSVCTRAHRFQLHAMRMIHHGAQGLRTLQKPVIACRRRGNPWAMVRMQNGV